MIDQIAILTLGVAAIWLSQDPRPRVSRWACVCGLAGQPFWIYASWTAGQWGILLSCALYTASWARGFRTHWLRRGP
jgi:hypothetical protein